MAIVPVPEAVEGIFKDGLIRFCGNLEEAYSGDLHGGKLRLTIRMPDLDGAPGPPVPSRPKVLPRMVRQRPTSVLARAIDDRLWRQFLNIGIQLPALAGAALIEAETAPDGLFLWTPSQGVYCHLAHVTGHEVLAAIEAFMERRKAERK